MSLRVTEEVMRWTLRFCSCRSQTTQRGILAAAAAATSPRGTGHIWGTRQNHTGPHVTPVGSVRFYSEGTVHTVSSPPDGRYYVETASGKRQLRSPFLDLLQRCGSPSDVLDLACQHTPTVQQVNSYFSQMWTSTKELSGEQRRYELQLMFEHPEFEKLLQAAMAGVWKMSCKEMAYTLLSMVNLGVPQNSLVVQTFLRACQEKLNSFDDKALSVLASCLGSMESSPNADALKKGMMRLVEARLPKTSKPLHIQTMMHLAGEDAPLALKRKLESKALTMADQFSVSNTCNMVTTMAKMDFRSKPLLDICSQKIIENIHVLSFKSLLNVLHSCRRLRYINSDLLAGISDYIAGSRDMWSNKQMLLFLAVFEDLNFCHAPFMEAFAERVMARPDLLTRKDLSFVLKVYSSLNFDLQQNRQPFLDLLTQALVSYLPNISEFDLLKAVFHLCIMGHFPSAPLEQLLHGSKMDATCKTAPHSSATPNRMFQMVDLCLRIDRPPLPQPLTVPPSLLGDSVPQSPAVWPWLSQLVQTALEDWPDATLQEAVTVENFHFVDVLVTKPPPSGVGEGEALSPAESGQRIAVICPKNAFCFGTANILGSVAVKLRHLKILGYNPVLLSTQELESLSQEERTEFLRGLIFPEHHRSGTQPPNGVTAILKKDVGVEGMQTS